jgi:hypothetical protein
MHAYEVGKPYIPGRTQWPVAADYAYRQNTHELRLFFRDLTKSDIRAIAKGECAFGLVVEQPVIILLYQFGGAVPWSDTPYSWHAVPAEQRMLPPALGPDERTTLHITLINADTGIIEALRLITLAPKFSQRLHAAIAEQTQTPFDQAAFDAKLAGIYRRYPASNKLLRAAVARTRGGA